MTLYQITAIKILSVKAKTADPALLKSGRQPQHFARIEVVEIK